MLGMRLPSCRARRTRASSMISASDRSLCSGAARRIAAIRPSDSGEKCLNVLDRLPGGCLRPDPRGRPLDRLGPASGSSIEVLFSIIPDNLYLRFRVAPLQQRGARCICEACSSGDHLARLGAVVADSANCDGNLADETALAKSCPTAADCIGPKPERADRARWPGLPGRRLVNAFRYLWRRHGGQGVGLEIEQCLAK